MIRLLSSLALAAALGAAPPERDASAPNAALAMARDALPKGTPSRESDHFILLTDAELASADSVLETLAWGYRNFQRACASIGVTPAPMPHKLVAILFRDQVDYQRFNARFKPGMPGWSAGYYDPMSDRLVMYDQISQANVQAALVAVAKNRAQIERQAGAAGIGPAQTGLPGNGLDQARQQLDRNQERIEADVRNAFLATVAHEATHGLFFGTGVQSRSVGYPFWVAEGLATNLEPTHARDRDFGFHRDNPRRRETFEEGLRTDQNARLRDLVLCDGAPQEDERGEVGRLYAQACIFTKWLARERPTELRRYLDALRTGSWSDPDRRLAVFEEIFGPVDALERCWMRAEARAWQALQATPMGARLKAFERAPAPAETPAPAAGVPSAPAR